MSVEQKAAIAAVTVFSLCKDGWWFFSAFVASWTVWLLAVVCVMCSKAFATSPMNLNFELELLFLTYVYYYKIAIITMLLDNFLSLVNWWIMVGRTGSEVVFGFATEWTCLIICFFAIGGIILWLFGHLVSATFISLIRYDATFASGVNAGFLM